MPKWPTQTHTQCYVRRKNSVFSYLRTLTTWHCPHSPAALPAVQQSIDISCWLGPQHQSCSSGFVAVGPRDPSTGIDRWRERRTFNRPRSAYSSSSSDNGADSIPSNIAYVGTMWVKKVKVAHTRLPSVGFCSWSRFFAVSLQVKWVINLAVGCHYFPPGLQLPPQPLRGLLPICCLVNRGTVGVNSLPKTVTRQRRDCDLNQGPSAPESSTLTTRLLSHPHYAGSANNVSYAAYFLQFSTQTTTGNSKKNFKVYLNYLAMYTTNN